MILQELLKSDTHKYVSIGTKNGTGYIYIGSREGATQFLDEYWKRYQTEIKKNIKLKVKTKDMIEKKIKIVESALPKKKRGRKSKKEKEILKEYEALKRDLKNIENYIAKNENYEIKPNREVVEWYPRLTEKDMIAIIIEGDESLGNVWGTFELRGMMG